MIGLDTNILVRYITQDDPAQSKIANLLLEKYADKTHSIFINNIVLCEIAWVLERGYKYSKSQIVKILRQMFFTKEFVFEEASVFLCALENYEANNLDFSDALILCINNKRGCKATYTFDRNAASVTGFARCSNNTKLQTPSN